MTPAKLHLDIEFHYDYMKIASSFVQTMHFLLLK